MREAKARGEIERFPGGRRKRGLPPLSKDRTIRKAQRLVEKMMATRVKGLPARARGGHVEGRQTVGRR